MVVAFACRIRQPCPLHGQPINELLSGDLATLPVVVPSAFHISKIAHTWIHLDRNVIADTEEARNVTYLTVRKNRFAHRTGPAGVLVFDPSTYIVSERQS